MKKKNKEESWEPASWLCFPGREKDVAQALRSVLLSEGQKTRYLPTVKPVKAGSSIILMVQKGANKQFVADMALKIANELLEREKIVAWIEEQIKGYS